MELPLILLLRKTEETSSSSAFFEPELEEELPEDELEADELEEVLDELFVLVLADVDEADWELAELDELDEADALVLEVEVALVACTAGVVSTGGLVVKAK